jgi:branched-chain amino acid transport system substrate-binding protein
MCMQRRAAIVVALCMAVLAACGTRVTEDTRPTATSLVERTVGAADGGGDLSAGDTTSDTSLSGSTGSSTGGSTGSSTGATTGSSTTSGSTTGGAKGPATGAPIVLGAVGTKSGIVGSALANGFRGLTVWEKWVNANGGIQGRPVKIIQVDDAADPGKHAAAVRKLIREDGVVAFIGNIAPFTLSAGLPLLEQSQIPAIGGDGGDGAWFTSPIAFPISGQTVARSRPAAKWAIEHLSQRKAALIYVSEAEAPSVLAHNFGEEWQKRGGQIVMDAGVSLVTPDFTGEVVQAQNSGADIAFVLLEKAACNRFFDAAQRQGYAPLVIAPACTIDNALSHRSITTNKLYSAGSVRSAFYNIDNPSPAQKEAQAAGRRFDPSLELDGAFMFGWLAGKLFQEAMAQPGAVLTGPGIIAALHKLPATTLGGLVSTQSWPPGPHPEGRCGLISLFNGEKFVLQTPDFVCA